MDHHSEGQELYLRFFAGRLIASEKPYKVSKLRSAAAICWTFIVSGLMHEFLIWYVLCYFVQGSLCAKLLVHMLATCMLRIKIARKSPWHLCLLRQV